jgi:hypothetical protein
MRRLHDAAARVGVPDRRWNSELGGPQRFERRHRWWQSRQ